MLLRTQSLLLLVMGVSITLCNAQGGGLLQSGTANFTDVSHNMVYCGNVIYPQAFQGSGNVHVIVSISHGNKFSDVHDSSVAWTESITHRSFDVCILESGDGTNGSASISWIAAQTAPSGLVRGRATIQLFTSGTKCSRVNFPQSFIKIPKVLVTATHTVARRPHDAMNVWLEDVHVDYCRVCLREVKSFDGKHRNVEVDWLAFVNNPRVITCSGSLVFENSAAPEASDNFAYCKVTNFSGHYYSPPAVLVTANHVYNHSNVYSLTPEHNTINTWVEEISITSFRVCVRDLAGMQTQHDPINVDYLVVGDVNPCMNKSCDFFSVCKAFGPRDARCVCVDTCPSYDEQVCSSNGTTYENECVFQREMCHLKANFTNYHPGSCTGFPFQKGRHHLTKEHSWTESVCEPITIEPYVFYPDKPLHIQISVNHINDSNMASVHDASVAWVESVTNSSFTACVTKAGRHRLQSREFATIDWLVYQGAPEGGVAGAIDMGRWWTGTTCRTVGLPSRKFTTPPTILLTADHERRDVMQDAASVWVEDVTRSSFKICMRELQDFDGVHENIRVDWIAFTTLQRPLFNEHGSADFVNTGIPQKALSYAFCEDIQFHLPYNKTPQVLVTANHSTSGANLSPEYNAITAWVEFINKTGFRACVKELYVNKHDPLSVSYAVLPDVCDPGWSFFNGSCFFTSFQCQTWTNAERMCRAMDSALASTETQEENVFVQNRHNGAKGWIGLNDIASEGTFAWVDGSSSRFTFWAKNQPNDMKPGGQDCVHTLGVQLGYKWNDVDCTQCHQYTCEKEYNDCTSAPCLNGGTCVDRKNDYTCVCPATHNGRNCEDYDECSSNPCHNGGTCVDGNNAYTCVCPSQYGGRRCQAASGQSCLSIKSSVSRSATGIFPLDPQGTSFQAYCDMSSNGGGWTLIARFSAVDFKNWMRDDGMWWYDTLSAHGTPTDPTVNSDMISEAFWSLSGSEIKITRTDDSSHTALLRTTSNCLGGHTFRSKISSYGTFKHGTVWSSDRCLGNCQVTYGGQYSSTIGFSQAHCSSDIQNSYYIGFWCNWSRGDGAVLMIGGGGSGCNRADHGLGITEANTASFVDHSIGECDFGDNSPTGPMHCPSNPSYALNVWIR